MYRVSNTNCSEGGTHKMGVTNSNKEVSVGSINCGGSFNVQFLDVFVNVLFAVWSIHQCRICAKPRM